jgi:hypothetical protein
VGSNDRTGGSQSLTPADPEDVQDGSGFSNSLRLRSLGDTRVQNQSLKQSLWYVGQVQLGFAFALDALDYVGIRRHMPDPPHYVAFVVKDSVLIHLSMSRL